LDETGLKEVLERFLGSALALLICAAGLVFASAAHADERPPNIVLMLSDNLGFGEIGVYGGGTLRGAPTPRLDRLAAEGLRFTNFNVEVECTPSRSALLTGRMPIRSGTWRAASAGLEGGLAPWEVTLAETLSDSGYATALFGKWHLGDAPGRYPIDQGFDTWWGFPFSTNVAAYTTQVGFDPAVAKVPHLMEGERGGEAQQVEPYTLENRPLIDERIAQKSIAYIQEHAGDERCSCLGRWSTTPTCPTRISRVGRATAPSPTSWSSTITAWGRSSSPCRRQGSRTTRS
jgi:arylsulfatase